MQNSTASRLPSGSRLYETKKSSKSIIVEPTPIGCKPDSTLYPSTAGIDSRITRTMLRLTAFFLSQPKISIVIDRMFSNTAITVDSAANVIKIKNAVPQMRPPAMWLKTFGSVINSKDGPESGCTPYAKHAGMMIMPAIRATNVSNPITLSASPVSRLDLSK